VGTLEGDCRDDVVLRDLWVFAAVPVKAPSAFAVPGLQGAIGHDRVAVERCLEVGAVDDRVEERRSTEVRSRQVGVAQVGSGKVRPRRFAPERFAPARFAPERFAPAKFVFAAFTPLKSTPVNCA
jgi:hypothetical protein